MWKGLENVGPHEGEPNNQHEWFLAIKVWKGGDRNLLHTSGSDHQTERLQNDDRSALSRQLIRCVVWR